MGRHKAQDCWKRDLVLQEDWIHSDLGSEHALRSLRRPITKYTPTLDAGVPGRRRSLEGGCLARLGHSPDLTPTLALALM